MINGEKNCIMVMHKVFFGGFYYFYENFSFKKLRNSDY